MPAKTCGLAATGMICPNIGGWIGGYIAKKNMPWYESLKKPSWTPPNWMYGPIWTSVYSGIGYSSYMVWRDCGGFSGAALPLSVYGLNLSLNWAWTPIFFGTHNIKLALCEIALLWGSTVALGIVFYQAKPLAGYLILPYLIWTSFAAALNYVLYRDNKLTSPTTTGEKKE